MAFWSDPSVLQPKQAHRWVVYLGDPKTSDAVPHYIAKSVDRPSYETGVIQTKLLYSHVINFPKRVVWKPIKIEFVDVVLNDATLDIIKEFRNGSPVRADYWSTQLFFHNFLRNSGYRPNNITQGIDSVDSTRKYNFKDNMVKSLFGVTVDGTTTNASSSEENLRTLNISELDSNGERIETWELYKPLITAVSPSKLDYSQDGVLNITIDVSYDWAELVPNKIKVGQTVKSSTTRSTSKPADSQKITTTRIEPANEYMAGLPTNLAIPYTGPERFSGPSTTISIGPTRDTLGRTEIPAIHKKE